MNLKFKRKRTWVFFERKGGVVNCAGEANPSSMFLIVQLQDNYCTGMGILE